MQPATQINNKSPTAPPMSRNSNNNTMIYEEEKTINNEAIRNPRGILDEIEDEELARQGHSITRIGILDEIEDKEITRRGTSTGGAYGGRAGGGAPALMDTIHINSSIEDRIRILSGEMIRRGLETEESFKRLRSYEKKRNEYRCLMEELARYYDRQTALGLPIEQLVLKTGVYMQHIILL